MGCSMFLAQSAVALSLEELVSKNSRQKSMATAMAMVHLQIGLWCYTDGSAHATRQTCAYTSLHRSVGPLIFGLQH